MTLNDTAAQPASSEDAAARHPWHDLSRSVEERVDALTQAMTVREKVAQLYGVWVGASADGEDVAPHQHDMSDDIDLDALLPFGLGQLTRPFGTAPVDPALGALALMRAQQRIVESSRFGIPALAHEECLAGFATWGATAYPVPLSWGATFDPELIREMGARIGADMRSLGVHQGLAPVLDVVRDARWGRVEETIGEDPYLVGTVASAYIRGLESADVVATLKHFVGYSASKGGRNLAPVSIGPRELADVLLPPFEMAVRESGARSVMNAYTDMDGVATAADPALLTGLLRDTWGFDGTVVADYFAIGFLKQLHGVAEDWADAGRLALAAGIDVELPTVKALSAAFVLAVEDGRVDAALVDRALRRVLRQKAGTRDARPRLERRAPCSRRNRVRPVRGAARPSGPRPGRQPRARAAGGRERGRAAHERRRPAARVAAPDRRDRPDRRGSVRRARLLLVPVACGRASSRGAAGHRPADPVRGARSGVPRC